MNNTKTSHDITRTELMLACLCINKMDSLATQIEILDRFGFETAEIAQISGAANQTITNVRSKKKKIKAEKS